MNRHLKILYYVFYFSYQTANGIHAQESGFIKNKGDKNHETLIQQGSVTYHDEHGHPITLTYVADEHGFQPQGSHLPTPPPVPAVTHYAAKRQSLAEPTEVDHESATSQKYFSDYPMKQAYDYETQ